MQKRYRRLPDPVYNWMLNCPLWLTGSGAQWYEDGAPADKRPRDFDLFVTDLDCYNEIRRSIRSICQPEEVRINILGGTKASLPGGAEVYVWLQSVDEFFSQAKRKGYSGVVALKLDPYVVLRSN